MHIDFSIMREKGFYKKVVEERKNNIKKVNEVGWKHVFVCPFCSTKNSRQKKFQKGYIKFNVCKKCQSIYAEMIPMIQNSAEYGSCNINEILTSRDEEKREYRRHRFGFERVELIKKYLPEHLIKDTSLTKLLDVGCNTGFFLEATSSHFNTVRGVEQNETIASFVSEELEVPIYNNLDEIKDITFDVITLFDVIEHVEKPIDFLKKCLSLLNKEGILVVFTPQWKSYGFDILDVESTQYYPTDHLQFLSKETVLYLAETLDMKLEMYETKGMDIYDVFAYLRDIKNVTTILKNETMDKIQEEINRTEYANHMRFILRRK